MRKRSIVAGAILALAASPLLACGQPDMQSAAQALSVPTAAGTHMHAISDYLYVPSFEAMVQDAPIIVIADLIGPTEIVNGSRDVDDMTKPATTSFGIAQVYAFRVQRYLKGSGADTINVMEGEGMVAKPPADVTAEDLAQARQDTAYGKPFRAGTTYLLVLYSRDAFWPHAGYYGGIRLPWRFALAADGHTTAEGPPDANINPNYGEESGTTQLARIEQLVKDAPSSAPAN